jgi:dsDNA-specific endonuclease/ATPase MutS2
MHVKSFTFQLKESKFPNLSILKNKEKALTEEINTVMQGLFSNKKYVSQLSGLSRRKPEPYELDGRIVVTASREVAQRIGVIRGHASNGSFSYVEPNEVVKLGNALMSIKEEISAQTLIISDHMSATILRSGGGIHQGLDAVARLDTIFARAAFGYTLNGFIPHIGNDGVIDVDNFVHPVLATKGGGGQGAGRGTVPIDLKMSCESSERSLIISGPNGVCYAKHIYFICLYYVYYT